MKRLFKYLGVIVFLYVTLNLLSVHSIYLLDRSINNQVNYIDRQLRNGADAALQKRYPEGALFANSIFALSIIERSQSNVKFQKKDAKIVDRCLQVMLSDEVTSNFSESLPLRYGAFYTGWTNYVLMKYIDSDMFVHSEFKNKFSEIHSAFNQTISDFQSDTIRLAETYHNGIWPADNLVCISSLPKEYTPLKRDWLHAIVTESANELKLINHDGYNAATARGSSQALILYFLSELDRELAVESNSVFKTHFVDNILGVKLVKEYVDEGTLDIDSGPIVFGYGSVATIMNIKAQSKLGENEKLTWSLLNLLGTPINLWREKHYLFEHELMFDIFMLWVSVSLR